MNFKKLNPAYVAAVKVSFMQVPYFQLLGMTMESLTCGTSEFSIKVQRKHLNRYHGVHGGVIASILDATCFWAGYSQMEAESAATTVTLEINYLAPIQEGVNLRCRGEVLKAGRRLVVSTGKVVEEPSERLVGAGTATIMVINGSLEKKFDDLPPKFLK